GIDVGSALVNIGDLDGVTDLQITRVDFFLADDRLEQRGFSDTVWTDDPDDTVWWQGEAQVVDQGAIAKAFRNIVCFDDLAPETRSGWDLDFFEVQHPGFLGFSGHFFVAFQTRLLLGLTPLAG